MFGWLFHHRQHRINTYLIKRITLIMSDLTKLQAAVADLEVKVGNLPPPSPDQTAEIDALADRITAAANTLPQNPPPAPAPEPAPTPTP